MGLINFSIFDPSGNQIFLDGDTLFLEEVRTYCLKIDGPEKCNAWLDIIGLDQQESGEYHIKIGHWVGKTHLRFEIEEKTQNIPIVVRPRSEKLSENRWLTMLQEIEEWMPGATLGGEGGTHGKVGSKGISSSLLIEALVPLLPLFEKTLKVLISQPRYQDKNIWIEQNFTKIRGCTRDAITWIARHPEVGVWLDPWKKVDLEGDGPRVSIRRSIDTVDHPANQYIAWVIYQVVKKLQYTQKVLRDMAGSMGGSDETSIWCNARYKRIDDCLKRIRRLVKNSFFIHVKKRNASESALLALFDDPVYARIHRLGRLFTSSLFSLYHREDSLGAAVKPSFSIYEIWCYLSLFNILRDKLENWQWKSAHLDKLLSPTGTGSGAFFSAKSPSGDQVLKILFNPVFISYHAKTNQSRWSISNERRPDFVISLESKETEGSWLFFDAKYRVGKTNLGDAFQSVHIYRDALYFDGYGDKCKAGCLIAPSMTEDAKEWFSTDFKEKYSTGIWELKPGQENNTGIGEWIIFVLEIKMDR